MPGVRCSCVVRRCVISNIGPIFCIIRLFSKMHGCVIILTMENVLLCAFPQHSCWLYVKKQKSMCLGKDDVIQVKDGFKWGKIRQELGAAVVASSSCEVSVGFMRPETEEDCHFLANSCPDCFKPTKNKAVCFPMHYPCPPKKTNTRCTALDTTCLHTSVFIAGRYNKFSRELQQTPWVIDGERRMDGSVEELIAAPLLSSFRTDGNSTHPSNGNGSPLTAETLKSLPLTISDSGLRTINQSSDKIRVRDLQIVTREAMSRMKEGEEEKTKTYSALIWTQKAIDSTDLEFLGNIMVLLGFRICLSWTCEKRRADVCLHLPGSLKLCTQAGTYIKQFVHRDFGRTKPNLCDLMKTNTDIKNWFGCMMEMFRSSVDIDWPPAIPD
uniref:tRNA pseudouridine(55) synthase n=1 Tax=Cyprinus carpio carpio TaxID=630221 RepID=A0A8C1H7Y4_CYPCA